MFFCCSHWFSFPKIFGAVPNKKKTASAIQPSTLPFPPPQKKSHITKEDFLGAHSDPVETIGPWAIIASMTFGAARHFRMKPVAPISYTGEGGELEEDR